MADPSPTSKPSEIGHATAITLLPLEKHWPRELRIPDSESALKAREQLGFPTDRPIITSGHQPIVFHPGIVAKLIALDHWSKETNAHPVWIVPDQDVVDPASIRIPVKNEDGTLNERIIRLGGEPNDSIPSCMLPPIEIADDLPEELIQLGEWIAGYTHEPTLARQFASATTGLLCEELDLIEPTIVYASELLDTQAGESLLDQLLDDPRSAISSYNAQAERYPEAGVRPLALTEFKAQLPLWRVDERGRDHASIDLDEPGSFNRKELIPTGLLMTAIMRSAACDLFIHGLGGMDYDQITEHWMRDWIGVDLSPMVGASASVYLDLGIDPNLPDPQRAVWEAHHARHDPAMLGDRDAAHQKQALIEQIEHARKQADRATASVLFSQLQTLLKQVRTTHRDQIERFDALALASKARSETQKLAMDRTWAFPLYSKSKLLDLKDQITRSLDDLR